MSETQEIDRQAAIVQAVTDKLAGPRFVWVLHCNEPSYEGIDAFDSKEIAVESLIEHIRIARRIPQEAKLEMIADLRAGDTNVGGAECWYSIQECEVQSRSAKSSPRNDA